MIRTCDSFIIKIVILYQRTNLTQKLKLLDKILRYNLYYFLAGWSVWSNPPSWLETIITPDKAWKWFSEKVTVAENVMVWHEPGPLMSWERAASIHLGINCFAFWTHLGPLWLLDSRKGARNDHNNGGCARLLLGCSFRSFSRFLARN